MRKKGYAIAFDTTIWYIIAIIVLILVVGAYFILKGKAGGALEFLKNLVRFKF